MLCKKYWLLGLKGEQEFRCFVTEKSDVSIRNTFESISVRE